MTAALPVMAVGSLGPLAARAGCGGGGGGGRAVRARAAVAVLRAAPGWVGRVAVGGVLMRCDAHAVLLAASTCVRGSVVCRRCLADDAFVLLVGFLADSGLVDAASGSVSMVWWGWVGHSDPVRVRAVMASAARYWRRLLAGGVDVGARLARYPAAAVAAGGGTVGGAG